jgi:succinate dehydrogenase / fumarate reductase, membrane anchor subunit
MEVNRSRWLWLLQALSGMALIVLVGMHLTAQHYLAAGGLRTYAEVVAYLRHPVALGLELSFLVMVTVHALIGVRAILGDLSLPPRLQRSIDVALWAVGLVTILYGLQLTWQVMQQ